MLNIKVWSRVLLAVVIGFTNGLVAQTLEEIVVMPAKIEEILDNLTRIRYMLLNVGQSDGYFTMASNPWLAQLRDVVDRLASKCNSEDMTKFLHDLSLTVNNFS